MKSNKPLAPKIGKKVDHPFTERFKDLIENERNQETAAKKIGVSRQIIGYWKRSEGLPDIDTLTKISKAYNVSIDYLLGQSEVKSVSPGVNASSRYTGLSEKAVSTLHEQSTVMSAEEYSIISSLLESKEMYNIAARLFQYSKMRNIAPYLQKVILLLHTMLDEGLKTTADNEVMQRELSYGIATVLSILISSAEKISCSSITVNREGEAAFDNAWETVTTVRDLNKFRASDIFSSLMSNISDISKECDLDIFASLTIDEINKSDHIDGELKQLIIKNIRKMRDD